MSTESTEEQLQNVIEITGASKEEAQHLLAACGYNVNTAVEVFFEQGVELPQNNVDNVNSYSNTNAITNSLLEEDDEVRAPIAPKREQLIGPEDDNFVTAPTGRLARLPQRVKVCPLRDFAREGALMEEQLQAAAVSSGSYTPFDGNVDTKVRQPGEPVRRISRAAGMIAAATSAAAKNSSRLGDLFRPPTDIAYAGSFASARTRAQELKQWLLVNVQSDNFDSQLLNRDIWADKAVRKLMRRQFILWQVRNNNMK